MSPSEAAKIIGCTDCHVRTLIRKERIKAKKVSAPGSTPPYRYEVTRAEAERVRDSKPINDRGRPRGPLTRSNKCQK